MHHMNHQADMTVQMIKGRFLSEILISHGLHPSTEWQRTLWNLIIKWIWSFAGNKVFNSVPTSIFLIRQIQMIHDSRWPSSIKLTFWFIAACPSELCESCSQQSQLSLRHHWLLDTTPTHHHHIKMWDDNSCSSQHRMMTSPVTVLIGTTKTLFCNQNILNKNR